MCHKKNGIIFLIIVFLELLCCIEGEKRYINNDIKDIMVDITREIGEFSTDKIYLVDLMTETYKGVSFTGETLSNNKNHIDVIFLTTRTGRRVAEIKIEPMEDKITVIYKCSDLKMALYDPNTGKVFNVSTSYPFTEWLNYDIHVDQVSEKIEITRMKNSFDYVTKF